MREIKLGELVKLIQGIISAGAHGTDDKAPVPTHLKHVMRRDFEALAEHCDQLGLAVPSEYLRRGILLAKLPPQPNEVAEFGRLTNMIADTIEIELRARIFLEMPTDKQKFYSSGSALFGGEDVANKFPSAAFEIDEAGKCIALDRHTACVFHLMRIMELGIRAMASCLGIPDPVKPAERNWGIILRKIRDDGIQKKWPTAADRMAGDGAVLESLQASLDAVKSPWRDTTMHVEKKYTGEEAQHIFDAVRGFMMNLASRCDANGEPKA